MTRVHWVADLCQCTKRCALAHSVHVHLQRIRFEHEWDEADIFECKRSIKLISINQLKHGQIAEARASRAASAVLPPNPHTMSLGSFHVICNHLLRHQFPLNRPPNGSFCILFQSAATFAIFVANFVIFFSESVQLPCKL